MRVLITGSRDWPDEDIVGDAIIDLKNWYSFDWDDVVIVHGHCPTGADHYADIKAGRYGLLVERHPANWARYGKGAGPKRNSEMVDKGADIVIAFMMEGSRGTKDCVEKAKEAGLPVIVYNLIGDPDDNEWTYEVETFNGAIHKRYMDRPVDFPLDASAVDR